MIDIQEKKSKILNFIKESGPSLPVQVARAIQMDPVFASAILSELISTKQVKTSQMKIGSSPLYLIPGQEKKLEEKSENLKPAEKETQEKLKSKVVIFDAEEEPATRVALRNIRDFAIPFKFQEKIAWKYAFATQEEVEKKLYPQKEKKEEIEIKKEDNEEVPKAWETKKEEIKKIKRESKNVENIFEEKKKETKENPKSQTTFLEKIEQFLKNKNTSIVSIEEVDKRKVIATIKSNDKLSMLFAFNKTRINEIELLKCYKEASKKNLPYQIIINGELTKKLNETILAHQKLLKINKLEI